MERIKKAVMLARQARQTARDGQAGVDQCANDATADPQPIYYTQSKTVAVKASVLRRNRVIAGMEDNAVTASYKILRTHVLQRMASNKWKTLAITSPSTGDGKTLTSVNLAVSIAKEVRHTVLLADLDLRRASVHRYLGFKPEFGIVDHLRGKMPLSDILINPGIEQLLTLPSSAEPVENSSELLASPKMSQLVNELKSRYDSRMVLFDLPPLLESDDTLAFLPNVDAVLLVIENGKTTEDALVRSMELLSRVPVLGTVLNKDDEKFSSYYD